MIPLTPHRHGIPFSWRRKRIGMASLVRKLSAGRLFRRSSTQCSQEDIGASTITEDADGDGYVPIIDLSVFREGTWEEQMAVADQIRRACEDVGFFMVTSHGVPQDVIDKAWAAAREFFDLPQPVKTEVVMEHSYPYGYCGIGAETLSKGKDHELGQNRSRSPSPAPLSDLKESFNVGPYEPEAGMPPRRWPSRPETLETAITAYYREMEDLARLLLKCFALALDLPEDWFNDKMEGHCSALRLLNYPDFKKGQGPQKGQLRASSHTDYGVLTILRQDDAPGGLQVKKRSGDWYQVPRLPGSFVINLGDLMSRWTNDRWVSTPHRVVCPPSDKYGLSRRQSMAYFCNLAKPVVVACIPTCCSPDEPPKHAPVNAHEWMMQKHGAATYDAAGSK